MFLKCVFTYPRWLVVGGAAILLVSCSTPRVYHGISPIQPKMGYGISDRFPKVDSLCPLLVWKDTRKPGETFDLIVWEYRGEETSPLGDFVVISQVPPGKLLQVCENLTSNSFQFLTPLEAGSMYCWSVRIRQGDKVGQWSRFSQGVYAGIAAIQSTGMPFGFTTPAKSKKQP